ncbi:Protein of unknown function [Catalinimonas alkaloidigena]|uniref:DUF4099 domain-containing protein n=1 Tax=Catalinimonas alkaloidigena TaxID=1075417 RepID=A0A1G9U4B2_9BACT|nr:DUF4099 domain-containing protein [Catalinimonas alkaloidigena]SDM54673.1 Protein of unknown function [Catalinimonas alkaloidigena]
MEYDLNRLPFVKLEKIGISKDDIFALPLDDIQALKTGRTTSLLDLHLQEADLKIKGKLSVYPLADGSLDLKVHPVRQQIQNDDQLGPKQLQQLQEGKLIVSERISLNGEKEKYLFQLDREINEIKKIRVADIQVPSSKLSAQQQADLLEGKKIVINTHQGEKSLRLDLINAKGYTLELMEQPRQVERKAAQVSREASPEVQPFHTLYAGEKKEKLLGKDAEGQLYEGKQTGETVQWKPAGPQAQAWVRENQIVIPFLPSTRTGQDTFYGKDLNGNYYVTEKREVASKGLKEGWLKIDRKEGMALETGEMQSLERAALPGKEIVGEVPAPARSAGHRR